MGCDVIISASRVARKTFQSTHPRGVRRYDSGVIAPDTLFQSTHPRGVRRGSNIKMVKDHEFQSTHPRGVRPLYQQNKGGVKIFQSTHPRGVRRILRVSRESGKLFQSTHPRGVRPATALKFAAAGYFNPRTHVGCDPVLKVFRGYTTISIHAPTWGATRRHPRPSGCRKHFNPRTHVGCDHRSGS